MIIIQPALEKLPILANRRVAALLSLRCRPIARHHPPRTYADSGKSRDESPAIRGRVHAVVML